MLLKLISCRVLPGRRAAFDEGQRQWTALASIPGFIGQCGGWRGDGAVIIGLWMDAPSYDHFMQHEHDRIAANAGQAGSYEALRIELFDEQLDMPGGDAGAAVADCRYRITHARHLRYAQCTVRPEGVDHFYAMQREVWAPGLRQAPGMLGGCFWRSRRATADFVVSTLWAGADEHARYTRTTLPALRARAQPDDDVSGLESIDLALEPGWTVVG